MRSVVQKARVFFLDIAEDESQALVKKLDGAPKFLKCDLKNLDELKAVLADIEAQAGPVSVLVNNAANDDRHTFEEVTPEYWNERINVNLRHYFFAAQAVVAGMKRAGGGAIINLGSVSGTWRFRISCCTRPQRPESRFHARACRDSANRASA